MPKLRKFQGGDETYNFKNSNESQPFFGLGQNHHFQSQSFGSSRKVMPLQNAHSNHVTQQENPKSDFLSNPHRLERYKETENTNFAHSYRRSVTHQISTYQTQKAQISNQVKLGQAKNYNIFGGAMRNGPNE